MANKEVVLELVENLIRIENEKKLLAEEQKDLFADYKEKLDVKALKAAMKIAKIKSRLGSSDNELDDILNTIESRLTLWVEIENIILRIDFFH